MVEDPIINLLLIRSGTYVRIGRFVEIMSVIIGSYRKSTVCETRGIFQMEIFVWIFLRMSILASLLTTSNK